MSALAGADGTPVWCPQTTLDILDRAVVRAPDALALVSGDVSVCYRDYGKAVAALATDIACSAHPGDTVVILLRNSIAIAVALFATQRAGCVSAALNPDYTAREIMPMLACAAPAVVIIHADVLQRLSGVLPSDARLIVVGSDADFVAQLLASDATDFAHRLDPELVAVLQFTGGTTGHAKGVELTHRAVATNVAQREAVLPTVFGDERVVCMMPMFHSFAAAMCVHLSSYAAGALVILPRYRPDALMDIISAHKITRLPAGPTVFNGLLTHPGLTLSAMASVRCAYSGSAPLSDATLRQWEAQTGVPIYEGYGQSEAGPILTYQRSDTRRPPARKICSVGAAVPLTDIRIVDATDGSTVLPSGESGEIIARGPQIMRGYRGQLEATAQALRGGWLHTGDIGHLDADGDLFIDDRKKDMVIVSGYNVYPREIDEVLQANPAVGAAAAVGVPDNYRGQVIVAFVVKRENAAALTADNLASHCARYLVRYKHPARFVFVDALPQTPVGKIDKVALRGMAERLREIDHVR